MTAWPIKSETCITEAMSKKWESGVNEKRKKRMEGEAMWQGAAGHAQMYTHMCKVAWKTNIGGKVKWEDRNGD